MRTTLIASLIAALIAVRVSAQTPLGTDFTYQGQLKGSGAISTADFQFSLYDSEAGGNQIGATLSKATVGVVNGLFTIALDFGVAAFNGDARWLEVTLRSPAGAGGYTTLTPRQPLTAAPYALQTRGITVDANDRVGIGTQNPAKKLTVAGDMELGTSSGDLRHMRIGGGNSDGFLYGSFPALGDGIHMGYNYYADSSGAQFIIAPSVGTSRVSMGYGSVTLATGGFNHVPVDRLFVNANGNVGIGTPAPDAKLDVRGNIRMGSSGQLLAAAGEENLRLLRGNVDGNGTIDAGLGFSVERIDEGQYVITFDPSFATTPSITVTPFKSEFANVRTAQIIFLTASSVRVDFLFGQNDETDSDFSFCVIGPR